MKKGLITTAIVQLLGIAGKLTGVLTVSWWIIAIPAMGFIAFTVFCYIVILVGIKKGGIR